MKVIKTIQHLRAFRASQPETTKIGLVATMGGLHDGHASLIRQCRSQCDVCIVTIFVNPAQFAPTEDLDQYPRSESDDFALCKRLGTDMVFAPTRHEMYPPTFATWVATDVGNAQTNECSEGASRPTFFRGVATVLTKLFIVIRAHRVYFGQKDAQQCAVVRQMVLDLNFDCQVCIGETVRENDGLAMSSRNAYLTQEERAFAPVLYGTLKYAIDAVAGGVRDAVAVRQLVTDRLRAAADQADQRGIQAELVYVSVCERDTMREIEGEIGVDVALLCVAMVVGKARLIDNVLLR